MKATVKVACYGLVCQVQEDTLLMLCWPVGDGASVHTALQRRFVFLPAKITTMKSVPVEECIEGKAEEKGVLVKDRKERRKI